MAAFRRAHRCYQRPCTAPWRTSPVAARCSPSGRVLSRGSGRNVTVVTSLQTSARRKKTTEALCVRTQVPHNFKSLVILNEVRTLVSNAVKDPEDAGYNQTLSNPDI